MPVEADFRDVLRLQVPESSFFFILLPPCIYLRISALILEEVFANEHGGYVGALINGRILYYNRRNGPAFASPFSSFVCQGAPPAHSTAEDPGHFLLLSLHPLPASAARLGIGRDPDCSQWLSGSG